MKKTVKLLICAFAVVLIILLVIILTNNKDENTDLGKYQKPEEQYTYIKDRYESNELEFTNISTEQMVTLYFNKIRKDILYYPKDLYETLDEEYKEEKFKTYDMFLKYTEENKDKFSEMVLEKYQINNYEDYNQYIFIDNLENMYILKEYAIMDYKLMLDEYTIDTPQFLEKYNSASDQEKVALNIQNIIKAINNKDYKYIYSKLSDGFKSNYFSTEETLKQYIKDNFYNNNNFELQTFNEISDEIYTYKVKISDKDDIPQSIEKTFVMKLNEGTDFEMSFNIN